MTMTVTDAACSAVDGSVVCPLQRGEIRDVANLATRVFLGLNRPATRELCEYLDRLFYSDPWLSVEVAPPMVYKTKDGAIQGFLGSHPRRLVMNGEVIEAAVIGQFMVVPSLRRCGIASRLTTAIMDWPQAITFTTSACEASASVRRKLGFWHPPFGGMRWSRKLAAGGGRIASLVRPLRSLRAARDISPGERHYGDVVCRPIVDARELCRLRAALAEAYTLCSDLDIEHAEWLLRMLRSSAARGRPGTCVVLGHGGDPIGWAVYYVQSPGIARLLEFACPGPHCREALGSFFEYATDIGIREVIGFCTSPELTTAAVDLGSTLKDGFSGWLIHCKDTEVQLAILNGRVFWSELDGEAWVTLRGHGETAVMDCESEGVCCCQAS